jgi:acid phosphatase
MATTLLLPTACTGGGIPATMRQTTTPLSASGTSSTSGTAQATSDAISKVLVVVLENHSRVKALDGMPRLRAQGQRYAIASNSYAVTHPSLPNYLAITGGSTFGVQDDKPPSRHAIRGTSVFRQVLASGGTARTYAEGMSKNCQANKRDPYAVKHNPWAYFVDERSDCQKFDVPAGTPLMGALETDVRTGRLPTFGLLVPDLCNDAHNCPLTTADGWLDQWLQVIESGSDFTSGKLLVVITFDEDDRHSGNNILTVFLHPRLHGTTIRERFDQYAVSGLISRMVGAPPLHRAASATDLLHVVRSAM